MDQGLSRLLQILKETGKLDETLVIFISDHGIPWPGAKTTTYDPGLRVPFVVRHPAVSRRGIVNNAMVSHVDLAPTILDFAQVKTPDSVRLHGRSFLPIVDQENPAGWDEVYASHTFHEVTMYYPMRVVRTRKHKLIWNIAHGLPFPFASDLWEATAWQESFRHGPAATYGKRTVNSYMHRPRFELYDLEKDPGEFHNLADDPQYANLLEELKGKIRAFQKRTGDPWILKWERE
jgi:N-sulfoglucosamine sulfohydrolase